MPRGRPSRARHVRWPADLDAAVEALAAKEARTVSQMYVIIARLGLLVRDRQAAGEAPLGATQRR